MLLKVFHHDFSTRKSSASGGFILLPLHQGTLPSEPRLDFAPFTFPLPLNTMPDNDKVTFLCVLPPHMA